MVQVNGKGLFITFEGGEGVGKTTQCRLLVNAFEKAGYDVVLTREPGGSAGAEEIRRLLVTGETGRWDSLTEVLLFMAARRDHLRTLIHPALASGKIVICDRFQDSTMAYQGYGYGDKPIVQTQISSLYQMIAGDFKPDITFILDIDPAIGLRRSCDRIGNTEKRFETMDLAFHQNLRHAFLKFVPQDPNRYHVIEATDEPEEIHRRIWKICQEHIS